MLTIYRDEDGNIRTSHDEQLPRDVIWIDLINPNEEERAFVESRTRVLVPSKDDLSKIEASSRIRIERGIIYLSMPVVATTDTPGAHLSPAGFIIWPDMLVTVRYSKLAAFDRVAEQVHADMTIASGIGVFTALLEAMVDRGSDILK